VLMDCRAKVIGVLQNFIERHGLPSGSVKGLRLSYLAPNLDKSDAGLGLEKVENN